MTSFVHTFLNSRGNLKTNMQGALARTNKAKPHSKRRFDAWGRLFLVLTPIGSGIVIVLTNRAAGSDSRLVVSLSLAGGSAGW